MTTRAEPLAVWDIRRADWWPNWKAKSDWVKDHGLPVHKTYRIEFYLLDAPFARVFCYALNERGKRHWNEHHPIPPVPHDHSLCDAAREEPRDVLLDELPPRELLGARR